MAGRRRRWPGRAGRAVVGWRPIAVGSLVALGDVGPGGRGGPRGHGRSRSGSSARGRAAGHRARLGRSEVGAGDAARAAGPPIRNGRARGPAGPAALDRAVLDEALAGLDHQGVAHGRIDTLVVVRPDLARVLVETRESAAPCAAHGAVAGGRPLRTGGPAGARRGRRGHDAGHGTFRPPCRPDLQGRRIRTGDPPRPPPGAGGGASRRPAARDGPRGRAGARRDRRRPRSTHRPRPDGDGSRRSGRAGSRAADHGRRPRDVRPGPGHRRTPRVEAGRDPR